MSLFDVDNIDEMANHFGFKHYPRAIGNPRQNFVFATEDIYRSYSKWNGNKSCFISTGGYDNLQYEVGNKQSPKTIVYELTFFDFDHSSKPENAFADAQRLSSFLREMNVAHWVQYSGSKGYHLFIVHEATRFKFDFKDGSGEALKQIVHQTQDHLRKTIGLNTLDEQTTGDPKRLCRFPFSKHIDRHGNSSGRHAMPVDVELLDTLSHEDIEKMSYRPKYELPKINGRKLKLIDFVKELGVKLHSPESLLRPVVNVDFNIAQTDAEASRFLASLDRRCMGVVNELKRRNPPHKPRVYSALFAKILGMGLHDFEKIWMQLGTEIGYVDLHNTEHRLYQMSTIFDDPKYYIFPNCTTLKANGCCVGDICPRFKDMGGMDYQPRQIKRKWSKRDENKST